MEDPVAAAPTKSIANDQHSTVVGKDQAGNKLSPLSVVGVTRRDHGNVVARQVFINCDVGRSDRKTLVCLPVHAIPLERALQRRIGGTVDLIASFAPQLPQVRDLTKAQLMDELERLRGNDDPNKGSASKGMYVIHDSKGNEQNIFHDVYGGVAGQPHRLFTSIIAAYQAWERVTKAAEDDMRKLTVEDLEEVVSTCMPPDESDGLDEIDALDLQTSAVPGSVLADQNLILYLSEQGVNEKTAQSFATAAAKSEGRPLAEEEWDAVHAVGKHPGKRAKLSALLESFQKLKPANVA